MSDFFRVARPVFPPSCCRLCTNATDPGGFVDLGADLESPVPDARVYVCSRCAGQLGAAFGMLSATDAADLQDVMEQQRLELVALEQQVEQAEGRGSWQWHPGGGPIVGSSGTTFPDLTVCPGCGGPKGATSKHCRTCSARIASDARKAGATA